MTRDKKSKMTKLYILAKKIHRLLVLIILVLALLMMGTGILMKFPTLVTNGLTFINLSYVRYLHNQLSVYFSAVLAGMIITGSWMYLYPIIIRRRAAKQAPQPPAEH